MQRVPGDLKTLQELISSGHVVNAGRGQHISMHGVRWHVFEKAQRALSTLFVRGN